MNRIIKGMLCLLMAFTLVSVDLHAANDTTAPSVEFVNTNYKRVVVDNKYIATLNVVDDTGVASVKIYYDFYGNEVVLDLKNTTGTTYVGEYAYNSYTQIGKYTCKYIEAIDTSGNTAIITTNISDLDFECYDVTSTDLVTLEATVNTVKTYYLYSDFDFTIEASDESVASAKVTGKGITSVNGKSYYSKEITVYANATGTASLYVRTETSIARIIRVIVTTKQVSVSGKVGTVKLFNFTTSYPDTYYTTNSNVELITDYAEVDSITTVSLSAKFKEAGTQQFTIYNSENEAVVIIQADITEASGMPFIDVPEGKWYYKTVQEAYELGLMTGKTETTFDPTANMTRGQVATVLYRIAGKPAVQYDGHFPDVPDGKYYSDAVTWCYQSGVVQGNKDGTFKPANNITRQELAIMLKNFAAYMNKPGKANGDLSIFTDQSTISSWAKDAVAWAVGNGVIGGKTKDGQLYVDPKANATRAECAKMLLNTYKLIQ